jgi:hypothetical protein
MRYVFKMIDFIVSVVFLALCIRAFCAHFYQDIEEQLRARRLPIIKDTPSLVPSDDNVSVSQG